ncbi:NUDIX domain-containing protein [Candidatus Parcubacteria bacterium]|nr:NUDIX domain-containing protein [Candidatus Parcubacteria bacterium]
MKKYTVGFIFSQSMDKVLLIRKLVPAWQAGMINGLGGKIEEGEDHIDCIAREIKEECGLITEKEGWNFIASTHSPEWQVDFFGYVYKGNMNDAKSLEQEQVEWFDVYNLPRNLVHNLTWLIPMSVDKIKNTDFTFNTVDVIYN